MDAITLLLFLVGTVLLVLGAEVLVRGAARLAVTVGLSPLVVGLTVVAFGTSAPELAVGISSAAAGNADIGVGNVVGSNIFNILMVLGMSAAITPLLVSQQLVRLDVPLLIVAGHLLLAFAWDGRIQTWEGAVLAAGAVVYTAWIVRKSLRDPAAATGDYAAEYSERDATMGRVAIDIVLVALGLALLVVGADWFVDGAVDIARTLGVSDLIVGLTVVAAGTSMPEVATSVMASIRGERDIAVGNAIGSSLFNILLVLGLTAVVADGGIAVAEAARNFDIPIMIATSVACVPVFFTGSVIARWEGFLFLAYYLAYVLYLFLDATGHDAAGPFSVVMLGFVVPLSVITLALLVVRAHRRNEGAIG